MQRRLMRLSSVLRPERSSRQRIDYNSSCNLIALGRETEENRLWLVDWRLESALPLLLAELARLPPTPPLVIVFPDDGALKRFRSLFSPDTPVVVCNKVREKEGTGRTVRIKEGRSTKLALKNCFSASIKIINRVLLLYHTSRHKVSSKA